MKAADTGESIAETVSGLIRQAVGDVADDTDLRMIEGVDSVKVLRVIAAVERTYDIELEDEEVFALKTIDDVVRSVQDAVQAQGA
ncbi:acyl carrier protein [Catenulispora pinisilvae]|uniref:acyl carrier protein n=1 Tax=Catenulispora pinisilvae TaxID=2705253 RepID=UPI0018918B72|nr:acyl carrier protein [Catenulispora pinisilvae]